mgnify:CR=1 FL=1
MKLKKKAVLRLLDTSGTLLSAKQIRGTLGLSKSHGPKIRALLNKLVQKAEILRKGAYYGSRNLLRKNNRAAADFYFEKEEKSSELKKSIRKLGNFRDSRKLGRSSPGRRLSGYFTQNPKGFGFVSIGGGEPDLFISEDDRGTALEGDRVEVEVLKSGGYRGRRKARIISVLERSSLELFARLEVRGRKFYAVPLSPRLLLPPVILPENGILRDAVPGTLLEIELENPEAASLSGASRQVLKARVLRLLEERGSLELGFELIIKENKIRRDFSESVLNEAEAFPNRVAMNSVPGRVDQRHLDYVTIDGESARDFDDAVCVREGKEGGFRLFVAIADVANYIIPGSLLDGEARRRGTSVYFPTHAIPMLPEALSNGLCSLQPAVNRLALTCEIELNSKGECVGYEIYQSLIRSRARLDYEGVTAFLDNGSGPLKDPERQKELKRMQRLMRLLEDKRKRRGAIQFEFPETAVEFDEQERMTGMTRKFQSTGMKIIEQFMLEANETVARHCVKRKLPALFRVHEPPKRLKLKRLQKILRYFGVDTSATILETPGGFNEVLEQIREQPQSEALQVLLLRSMALAVYQQGNQGHFGLAAEYYTHFTSPIRRYPDLLVHRALKNELLWRNDASMSCGKKKDRLPKEAVDHGLALHCSHQERKAEKAELQSIDLMKCVFLEKHTGSSFQSVVRSVDKNAVGVELEPHALEWKIPLETITDDLYRFDDERLTLFGSRKGRRIQVGQRLELRLLRVDTLKRSLEFSFECWLR